MRKETRVFRVVMGAYVSRCWTFLTVESTNDAAHDGIARDERSPEERAAAVKAARERLLAKRAAVVSNVAS